MKIKKTHRKGNHFIIDGYSENQTINNKKFIKQFLIDLTKKIKMKSISKPLVVNYKARNKSESGISGAIILAESSIIIHTYPNKNLFFLDIFSCKEFNINKTKQFIIKKLKLKKLKTKLIKRGIY